jgi:hypothetical protein
MIHMPWVECISEMYEIIDILHRTGLHQMLGGKVPDMLKLPFKLILEQPLVLLFSKLEKFCVT